MKKTQIVPAGDGYLTIQSWPEGNVVHVSVKGSGSDREPGPDALLIEGTYFAD